MKRSSKFRIRLFGGFDRRDVTDYIKKLIREREDLKKQIKLSADSEKIDNLTGEISRLTAEKEKLENSLQDSKAVESQLRRDCDIRVIDIRSENERHISDINRKNEKLISELEALRARFMESEAEAERAKSTLKEKEAVFSDVLSRYRELSEKLMSIQPEL